MVDTLDQGVQIVTWPISQASSPDSPPSSGYCASGARLNVLISGNAIRARPQT